MVLDTGYKIIFPIESDVGNEAAVTPRVITSTKKRVVIKTIGITPEVRPHITYVRVEVYVFAPISF